jgi:hypothetical protein
MKLKQPRYRRDFEKRPSRRLQEASTNHSRLMGKPNDGMAELLTAIEDDIDKLDGKDAKGFEAKMSAIDTDWEKVWGDIVALSKSVTSKVNKLK